MPAHQAEKNASVLTNHGMDGLALIAILLAFWPGVLWHIDLPGFYMDAVNPDYLAAQTINPELNNPSSRIASVTFPILGSYYHGVQNYYVDLLVFKAFGIGPATIRVAQALFGAGIAALLYFFSRKATGNRLISCLAAVLLATDIAFLASFRTQFYIVLSSELWLFASLLALWRGRRLGYFLSGALFGLAVYGYFVLGFFGPALAVFAFTRPDRKLILWAAAGFVVGMFPYVAGYASMVIAFGGVPQAIDHVRQAVLGLAPMASKLSAWESLQHAVLMGELALNNIGNELMIFGEVVTGSRGDIKFWLFCGAFALAAARFRRRPAALLMVLLPVSYMAVAAMFGSRLWVHHFSVLVPIAYLLTAVSVGDLVRGRWASAAAIAVAALLLAGNVQQSQAFHDKLAQTGGTGKFSDALTRLAEDALRETGTLYVFPEWGFFMPFNLLTANRVPYVVDAERIDRAKCGCDRVALAFWSADDTAKYTSVLNDKGLRNVETEVYAQRDGRPAFYVVKGEF